MERIDFRWRYQPRNELDAQLMQYIQDNQMSSKTEMLLLALRSFWLPYALLEDCSGDKEKMRRIARSAVQTLRKQAQDIVGLVGLEEAPQNAVTSLPYSKTPQSNTLSLDALRHLAGENDYDDAGLINFL
ncbi:hypothetical protein [Fischerella thermalis]|uniref:Uncharacterized protein n=1 Tax=Fischerella thermalis CCMEE 5318 TaxID=2019666 RepID=A0A2N6LEL6_9CYAN|nr:hypothetical protein [Fischerella thermalis]PMB21885.1 hypothetical protein CEN46_13555 [Fischerella thermalis CCMEE 5318]